MTFKSAAQSLWTTGKAGGDFFATGLRQARYKSAELRGMTPRIGPSMTPMSASAAAIEAYGRNGRLAIGGGAALGLGIGTAYGHPLIGAAAGAGAGLALKAGLGMPRIWNKLGPIGQPAAIAALAGSVFLGASAFRQPEYQSSAEAVPDGMGGYEAIDSGVSQRMSMMGATGDIVLGLHNRNTRRY